MPNKQTLTHEDFPDDLVDLTTTQYASLLEHCKDREEKLKSSHDRRDSLRDEADRDKLTGLWNRRGLDRRTKGRDWGWWVLADIDDFKRVQDTHPDGHPYGDLIISEIGTFIQESTRREAICARIGGDEFAIWVESRQAALRLRNSIREWRSRDGRAECSAGIGETPEAADAALYMNKQTKQPNSELV